ncbi:DUF3644 domain-containing protein [Corynebacterium frankenforstense]|uniref:DUF3644 domain-containing protein n=1 Tax=Corynebacterium frankenforstense TaxID=1230998 RepID=UPI0034E94DE0
MRENKNIYYRKRRGKRFFYVKNADGTNRIWELGKCLKEELKENDPVRVNIEFFIGLRNHVEHSIDNDKVLLKVTSPQAHACIINYEKNLIERFGREFSLRGQLRIPIFVSPLDPGHIREHRDLTKDLPKDIHDYLTGFKGGISPNVQRSSAYAYKLYLIPYSGNGNGPDMAVTFVKYESLTAEMKNHLSEISTNALEENAVVVVKSEVQEVSNRERFLPKAAAEIISGELKVKFGVNDFTVYRKYKQVGPVTGGSRVLMNNSKSFCFYDDAVNKCVYDRSFIDLAVKDLRKEGVYKKLFGKSAKDRGMCLDE